MKTLREVECGKTVKTVKTVGGIAMKQYLDQWKVIEGSLREERIEQLPDCLEKEHLFQISGVQYETNSDLWEMWQNKVKTAERY